MVSLFKYPVVLKWRELCCFLIRAGPFIQLLAFCSPIPEEAYISIYESL